MNSNSALIIFIKNPEKGKVKTRIAKTAGEEKALAIYISLMEHTHQIALSVNCSRHLFYSQRIQQEDNWSSKNFKKLVQAEGNLGHKMATAFKTAFQQHQKVVIIGSDCASLTPAIVEEAFKQLDNHDFVVGPTFDGGYYLLGMSSYQSSVFEDIEWSTESVFPRTIENIDGLEASYFLMPILSDIDYEEDWDKYGWEL